MDRKQIHTQEEEGVKPEVVGTIVALLLLMLDKLLTREKDVWPTGIFPLAFSDMPLSCIGTASSIEEIEGVLEFRADGDD